MLSGKRGGKQTKILPRVWDSLLAFVYAVVRLEVIEHGVGPEAQRQESGEGEGGGG